MVPRGDRPQRAVATVVDVVEGISFAFADPAMAGAGGDYATFVVQVSRVLSGTGARPGSRVYAQVGIGSSGLGTRRRSAVHAVLGRGWGTPRTVNVLAESLATAVKSGA